MATTVIVADEAYRLVIKKQNDMFEKTGTKRSIKDIVEQAIKQV